MTPWVRMWSDSFSHRAHFIHFKTLRSVCWRQNWGAFLAGPGVTPARLHPAAPASPSVSFGRHSTPGAQEQQLKAWPQPSLQQCQMNKDFGDCLEIQNHPAIPAALSQSDDPKQGMVARYGTRVAIFSRPGSRPRGLWGLAVALTGKEACVSLRTFGGTSRGDTAQPLPLVGEHSHTSETASQSFSERSALHTDVSSLLRDASLSSRPYHRLCPLYSAH